MSKKQIKLIVSIIIIELLFIYIYTLFHELGHGLIGIINGGRIINLKLGLNAHITIANANYTNFTYALMNVFGILLPILILIIALLIYDKQFKKNIYHLVYIISSIGIASSTIPWIILPIISLFTKIPANDDIAKFLNTTSLNPIFVAFGSFILLVSLVILVYKKGLLSKLIEIRKELESK